ncbi:MAG: hypothetical protein JXR47_00955 [Thiotrichales bacterium]|nr:hypothetical protein [Thiotrichales bacterium]
MDIWTKAFLYGGAAIGAVMLMVVIMMLGHAENGVLTVQSLDQMAGPLQSFYAFFKWFVYAWLISAVVVFVRFIRGMFR